MDTVPQLTPTTEVIARTDLFAFLSSTIWEVISSLTTFSRPRVLPSDFACSNPARVLSLIISCYHEDSIPTNWNIISPIVVEVSKPWRTKTTPISQFFMPERKRTYSFMEGPIRLMPQQANASNLFRYASLIRELSAGRMSLDNVPDKPSSGYSFVISHPIL